MKIIVNSSGISRRIDGPFRLCGSAADLKHVADCIGDWAGKGHSYGWLDVPQVPDRGLAQTEPLTWTASVSDVLRKAVTPPIDPDFAEVGQPAPRREVRVEGDGVHVTEQLPGADTRAGRAYADWWHLQTLKGDPSRRPNLTRDAYGSGYDQGRVDARFEIRDRARQISDGAIMAFAEQCGLTNLSPRLEKKLLTFGRACLNDGAGVKP